MLVEELIEELRAMPATAVVEVQIRKNMGLNSKLDELYEFRTAPIVTVVYDLAMVQIQLDE